jgi:hypothetical protein
MDAKSEQLLREIKKYQKSTVAYEKARLKMIEREHRALGLTDAVVQRELKSINVDVKSLLKDTAAEKKDFRRTHKKFLASCDRRFCRAIWFSKFPPTPTWRTIRFDSHRLAVLRSGNRVFPGDRRLTLPPAAAT